MDGIRCGRCGAFGRLRGKRVHWAIVLVLSLLFGPIYMMWFYWRAALQMEAVQPETTARRALQAGILVQLAALVGGLFAILVAGMFIGIGPALATPILPAAIVAFVLGALLLLMGEVRLFRTMRDHADFVGAPSFFVPGQVILAIVFPPAAIIRTQNRLNWFWSGTLG